MIVSGFDGTFEHGDSYSVRTQLPPRRLGHLYASFGGYRYAVDNQGDTPDPEFGEGKSCDDYTKPVEKIGAHVAALGLTFYTGGMFPAEYRNQLFIARHGSWNRSEKVGFDILLVRFDDAGNVAGQEVFASGWLQGQKNWGRPNDVMQMPDGALLVPDDQAGVIYRISHTGN